MGSLKGLPMKDDNIQRLLEAVDRIEDRIERIKDIVEDSDDDGSFFRRHRHNYNKGELMSELDQITTDAANLTTVVNTFITDYNAVKAARDAAVAAGSASVPLTALDPIIASIEANIAAIGAADTNAVVPPPATPGA
jgi:hypothetical protein